MFSNHLKVNIRNIRGYNVFSLINGISLARVMLVYLLRILMLADQKKYRQVHAKKNRIYPILFAKEDSPIPQASTPIPLAGILKSGKPTIKDSTHLLYLFSHF